MRQSAAQSFLAYPLTAMLGSGSHVRVLRTLSLHGGPLSASRLAQETKLTYQGVRLALDSLSAQGVVRALGEAGSQLYVLSTEHPLSAALEALFAAEQARWENVLSSLRQVLDAHRWVRAAWLYGSVARGEDTPASDLDVALLVDEGCTKEALDALLQQLQALGDRLFFQCSAVWFTEAELLGQFCEPSAFWENLQHEARVLVGERPEAVAKRLMRDQQAA